MKKAIFTTTQSTLLSRNGQEVEVGRPLTLDECDIEDVGNMFKIKFEDGEEIDAFEDELNIITQ